MIVIFTKILLKIQVSYDFYKSNNQILIQNIFLYLKAWLVQNRMIDYRIILILLILSSVSSKRVTINYIKSKIEFNSRDVLFKVLKRKQENHVLK